MDREKYYEQILNAVDTGILVVDSHDNILQHNQAALRLLDTDVLTHMNQVKGKLKDEHLAKHETQAMLKDKPLDNHSVQLYAERLHRIKEQCEIRSADIRQQCTLILELKSQIEAESSVLKALQP